MSVSSLDRAVEGSGVDLLGSTGERRRPTHGRLFKSGLDHPPLFENGSGGEN